tara:strand:- start:923 stop:1090 length:168 start_codon:yes stop_codon:yes gene_type:complete
MILKTSPFSIQDEKIRDIDNISKKFSNIDDLIKGKDISIKEAKTVHRRRDLDSLG